MTRRLGWLVTLRSAWQWRNRPWDQRSRRSRMLPPDSVTLKEGTVIYGQGLGMVADELHIKTSFGPTAGQDIVKIMSPNVAKLSVNRPIPFSLKEGTTQWWKPHSPASRYDDFERSPHGHSDSHSARHSLGHESARCSRTGRCRPGSSSRCRR